MIDINKVNEGDRVRMDGEVGVVTRVDHEEYEVIVDFKPDDPAIDGEIDLSVDEPGLELVTP